MSRARARRKHLNFPARLSTSASSHHDLSLVAFITNLQNLIFGTHTPAMEWLDRLRQQRASRAGSVDMFRTFVVK
jgi:hypothetical protein